MSDWWAKRLVGGAPAPAGAPQRQTVPLAPPSQQRAPAAPQHPYPGYVQPPPAYEAPVPDHEFGQAVTDTIYGARPSVGNRDAASQGRCPSCGGTNLFSRQNGQAGINRTGAYPAPECFDCGWPLVQAGSVTGSIAQENVRVISG